MPFRSRRPATITTIFAMSTTGRKWLRARVGRVAPGDRHRRASGDRGRAASIRISLSNVKRLPRTPPRQRDAHHARRIDAKARLRIGDRDARRPGNPEAREAVGAVARRRELRAVVQARADHEALRVCAASRQQDRRIGRIVLAVAVERDHAARVLRQRMRERGAQAGGLALIVRVHQQRRRGKPCSCAARAVAGAVVDDDDARAQRQRLLRQRADRARLLVGGDRDPHAVPQTARLGRCPCAACILSTGRR